MCHIVGDGEWHGKKWVEGAGAQGVASARRVCGWHCDERAAPVCRWVCVHRWCVTGCAAHTVRRPGRVEAGGVCCVCLWCIARCSGFSAVRCMRLNLTQVLCCPPHSTAQAAACMR